MNIICHQYIYDRTNADDTNPKYKNTHAVMLIFCVEWILALQSTTIDFLIVAYAGLGMHQRRHTFAGNVELDLAHIIVAFGRKKCFFAL